MEKSKPSASRRSQPPAAPESPPTGVRTQVSERLRLRHVNCIVAIAQERTLARAAERLHLSQPAISKTLAELEQWAGARLVERGRNGAALTAAGEHFLRYALDVRRAVDASAAALAHEDAHQSLAVRVGVLPTVQTAVLPTAIVSMKARMPGVGVQIQVASNAELLGALKAGEIDLMVGRMAEPSSMKGISFEYLYTESLTMVARAGHPLTGPAARPTLEDVLVYPLVIAGAHTAPRHHTEVFFESSGLALPQGCIETQASPVARLVVRTSDAIWIVPRRVAQDDLDAGLLALVDVPAPRGVEQIGILRRSQDTLSDAVGTFAEQLRRFASA
jgi:DNA-binding transcriptional LysR family regulator